LSRADRCLDAPSDAFPFWMVRFQPNDRRRRHTGKSPWVPHL